ncbi:MAG: hypothetical protein ACREPG_11560 [Candidatus Binatia bacterium]
MRVMLMGVEVGALRAQVRAVGLEVVLPPLVAVITGPDMAKGMASKPE